MSSSLFKVNVSIALKNLQLRNISPGKDISQEEFLLNGAKVVFMASNERDEGLHSDENGEGIVTESNTATSTQWEQVFSPDSGQSLTFSRESIIVMHDASVDVEIEEDEKKQRNVNGRDFLSAAAGGKSLSSAKQNLTGDEKQNVEGDAVQEEQKLIEENLNNAPAITVAEPSEDEFTDPFDDLVTDDDIPLAGTSKPMKVASAVQALYANKQKELEELEEDAPADDDRDVQTSDNLPDMAIEKPKSNLWKIEKSYSYLNRIQNKTDTKTIVKVLDLSTIIGRRDIWKNIYAIHKRSNHANNSKSSPSQSRTFYIEFVMNNLQWTPQPRAELVFRMQMRVESMKEVDELAPTDKEHLSVDQLASSNISFWKQSIDPAFFAQMLRPHRELQQEMCKLEQQLSERELKISQLPAPPFISLPDYDQSLEMPSVMDLYSSRSTNRSDSLDPESQLRKLEQTGHDLNKYLTKYTERILLNDRWMPHVGRLMRSHIIPHTIDFLSHKLRVKQLYEGNCFLWREIMVGMCTGPMSPAPGVGKNVQLEEYWNNTQQISGTPCEEEDELIDERSLSHTVLHKLVMHVQLDRSKMQNDYEKMSTFLVYAVNMQMLHKWIKDLYSRETVLHMYDNGALVKHPFTFGKFMKTTHQLSQMPWRIRQQENEE